MSDKGFELLNEFRYSTVKLIVRKNNGATSCGTGFFYDMNYGGMHCLLLVTNKHMAEEWQVLTFKINKGDEK